MPRIGTLNQHVYFLEHGDTAPSVDEGKVLWRRNDHGADKRGMLGQRQLRIARAGRHIDNQHVELTPLHFAQKLSESRHRPCTTRQQSRDLYLASQVVFCAFGAAAEKAVSQRIAGLAFALL